MKKSLLLLLLTSSTIFAEDGATIYNTYCGACHSMDGKGAGDGAFPPLAKSEWVQGDPARMVQVILHGLEGPIEVTGKNYDLVMPPQGSALTDSQITSITNYVRSSWGNKESTIKPDFIEEQRQLSKDRNAMWESKDLLELYPIEIEFTGINELLSQVYNGKFSSLTELRAAEENSIEEEQSGFISANQGGSNQENFGVVWEGWLEAPQDGDYTFHYTTEYGGAVTVDGKEIIKYEGKKPLAKPKSSSGTVSLKKGRFNIKVEYYHLKGSKPRLALAWKGPGVPKTILNYKKPPAPIVPIILKPEANKTIIHRNFLQDTDARGIAVGYPERMNLIFSADSMNLDAIWHGDYIDVGEMWSARGKSKAKLLGKNILNLGKGSPIQRLLSPEDKWNAEASSNTRFEGYTLNDKEQPTFLYQNERYSFEDELIPLATGKGIQRTITVTSLSSSTESSQYYVRLFGSAPMAKETEDTFVLNEQLSIQLVNSKAKALSRSSDLIIPIIAEGQDKQIIQINYLLK